MVLKRGICLFLCSLIVLCLDACNAKQADESTPSLQNQQQFESTETGTEETTVQTENEANIISGDEHPYIGTKSAILDPTSTAPAIDGFKDKLYDMVGTLIVLNELNSYYWPEAPKNDDAQVYVTYDKEYLYLFAEVSDQYIDFSNSEHVWEKDSIGVLLDFNYTRTKIPYTEYAGAKIGYVNISCDNKAEYYHEYLAEPYCSMISYSAVYDPASNMYCIEMCLPFSRDFTGSEIGFEVINTDCFNGSRCGVRTWNVDGSQMYQYTHCAGTIKFSENLWAE